MKIVTKIYAIAVAVLGFTTVSCKKMYGSPMADFKINVAVVDKATENGIRSARVIVKRQLDRNPGFVIYDTLIVDDKGIASATLDVGGACDMDVTVVAEDMGELAIPNKLYKTDSVQFHIDQTDYKDGDGHWYAGVASKDVTIKLEKEQ